MLLPIYALPVEPAYRLVWSDEFSKDGRPDEKNWNYEHGFVRNKELQYYRQENAWVQDGRLIIEGRRESTPIPNERYEEGSSDWRKAWKSADYSSACLITKGKREFKFGRFEIRAKIDARPGLWPAIWTLGIRKPWPQNGEVDLLEFYQNTILANTAWANGTWNTQKIPYSKFTDKDANWGSKFHVWRMDWDENRIRIYLDNDLVNDTDLSKTLNPDGANAFHQPQYLLLNLALGSSGGDPSKTAFPSRFEVDYVRVYQRA